MDTRQKPNTPAKDARTGWRQRLQDPKQSRFLVTACLLLAGYGGIYVPLSDAIAAEGRKLKQEQSRRALANQIEQLREQSAKFQGRVPTQADTNEWLQYVLSGVRQFPVNLTSLDPGESRRVGPYQAIELKVQLEGRFEELHAFLCWLETNQRLFRVESMKTTPPRGREDSLEMSLTVLGLSS